MKSHSISMRCLRSYFRSVATLVAIGMLVTSAVGEPETPIAEAARLLPDTIDGFHAQASPQPLSDAELRSASQTSLAVSAAMREYANDAGFKISIRVVTTERDSAAYALLTQLTRNADKITDAEVGIANVTQPNRIRFCKGDTFVEMKSNSGGATVQDQLLSMAKSFAATLPEGDDDIPVLVRHLPEGQTSLNASYAVSTMELKDSVPNQPALDIISFEGGTEAVAANYGQSQMVITEFTTPQFAGDSDRSIVAKIQELKSLGQAVPSAYRRVGNYSVFVFNAPDEKTANELIDQVKYQKVVQWLGEDPHLYEKLEKYFAQTSAGVLIAVLESSGLSLLICLGLGALFGTLLFRYRRAQRATRYSDAGGTVRLNLDELTAHGNSRGLLKSPSPRESSSKHS